MNLSSVPCRSCGEPVLWLRTETGKWMPVDADPSPKGNLILLQSGRQRRVKVVTGDPPAGRELYLSHFATCPNAAAHRRQA